MVYPAPTPRMSDAPFGVSPAAAVDDLLHD